MSDKITINEMDSLCDSEKYYTATIKSKIGDETVELKIKHYLSIAEEQDFIERVASAVINDTGYFPALLEPVFLAVFIQTMTNISLPTKKAGDDGRIFDLNKINDWRQRLDIDRALYDCRAWEYVDELKDHVCTLIDYKKQQLLNNTPLNDLISKFSHVLENYQSVYGDDLSGILGSIGEAVVAPVPEAIPKATILDGYEQLRIDEE